MEAGMAEKDVLFETRDGVGVLTLNRPDKLNALGDYWGTFIQSRAVAYLAGVAR